MRLMSSTSWEEIFTTIRNLFHIFMFYILNSTYLYRNRGYFFKWLFFCKNPYANSYALQKFVHVLINTDIWQYCRCDKISIAWLVTWQEVSADEISSKFRHSWLGPFDLIDDGTQSGCRLRKDKADKTGLCTLTNLNLHTCAACWASVK